MKKLYYSNTRQPALTELPALRSGSWIHIVEPDEHELEVISKEFELDLNQLRDAIDPYEAPRVEQEDGMVYVFTRYYNPGGGEIVTEPLLVIYMPDYIMTVQRKNTPVLDRLFSEYSGVITSKKTKTMLQILEEVNASYRHRIYRVSKQIMGIRTKMNKAEVRNEDFIKFIDLEEELNDFLSALLSQSVMYRSLLSGRHVRLYEEDEDLVEDLSLDTAELIELAKSRIKTISNTREAYSTIMANTLNKTFKRLTSISIFMTIPAITAGLYGMNLALPLQKNANAFWFILLIVMSVTTVTVWLFKRKNWL